MTTRARPPRRTGLRAGSSAGGWAPALTPSTAMRIAVLVKQIPAFEELQLGPDGRLERT